MFLSVVHLLTNWRRASGVPPRLGLKRAGTSRLHAVVHISKEYEGFPGKGAEDRGAVSSAETGLEEDVIDTIDILSRRQYLEKIIKFHMISMV